MKLKCVFTASALLIGASLAASAAVGITASNAGTLGTMPGSASDYVFFGNPNIFPGLPYYGASFGGTNPEQPYLLTDFTVAAGDAGGQFAGTSGYSNINGPVGSSEPSVATGDLFSPGSSGGDVPDIVNFTLGTPGSTFDFSNFNIYVMYGNGPGDANDHDTNIDLSVYSASSHLLGSAAPVLVTDENTSTAVAYFEEFHITGASAGDVIEIGAGSVSPFSSYFGGVSFSEAPEPSAWALMLGGVALLGFRLRRQGAKFQV